MSSAPLLRIVTLEAHRTTGVDSLGSAVGALVAPRYRESCDGKPDEDEDEAAQGQHRFEVRDTGQ
jgi:hypothetical protein